MKHLQISSIALCVLAGALAFAGCGGEQTPPAGNTVSTAPGGDKPPLKIALLTPGDVNDQGWNQLAYEGLEETKKTLGAEVAHQVTKNPSDQQPAMQDLASQNYDVIMCHGFEYGEKAKAIAKDFPNTKFVVVAGNVIQEPNVATIVPKLEDATYLLGILAGSMSKTGKVGMIGGMNLTVIQSTFDAFAAGAKAANPKIQVLKPIYIGNFEDQNAGKEAAKSLIAQGADFLIHNADQAGKGMFAAAKEAKDVMVFGTNRDQNSVAPDVTLASAVIEMPRAFVEIGKTVQEKKFKAQFYELNLANGDISIHWNDKLKAKVPPAVMKKVRDAEKQIKEGKLKIKRNV